MKKKLTASNIKSLTPAAKRYEVWDTEIKGFYLRVLPSGGMSYYLHYRHHGRKRDFFIGKPGSITPAQAREVAARESGRVAHGIDIQSGKKEAREKARADRVRTLEGFLDRKYGPWVTGTRKTGEETLLRIRTNFGFLMERPLESINNWVIDSWRKEQRKRGKQDTTINRDIVSLKAVLSKAVEWEVIDEHPLAKLKPIRTDKNTKVRYLTEQEEKRLREALRARDERIREERGNANEWRRTRGYEEYTDLGDMEFADYLEPIVRLALNTGMRRGELFNLKWEDIDFTTSILTVVGHTSKTQQTRHVPLNPEARHVLKKWGEQSNGNGYVFPSRDGGRMNNIRKSWAGLLKLAAIQSFRFHDLRHHFASKLVMNGIPLNTVRDLLGHADFQTTLRYAHLAPDHKAEAVGRISGGAIA